jgi:hypothetical protein
MASNSLAKIAAFEAANRECALIIVADPMKYPPDSLPANLVSGGVEYADRADRAGHQEGSVTERIAERHG